MAYTIFYQRIISDKIVNFIDLCSVSNISVFILDQNQHGYYIHGRSPHGLTDVNMKQVIMNLHREENQMIGTRGLENNSNEQIFIMKINKNFKKQYELLFQSYYVRKIIFKSLNSLERKSLNVAILDVILLDIVPIGNPFSHDSHFNTPQRDVGGS